MTACVISHELAQHQAQYDQAERFSEYKESLISDFERAILSGATIKIDKISYSFDEVLSDACHFEAIDKPLAALMASPTKETARALERALRPIIKKITNNMADQVIELYEDGAHDFVSEERPFREEF